MYIYIYTYICICIGERGVISDGWSSQTSVVLICDFTNYDSKNKQAYNFLNSIWPSTPLARHVLTIQVCVFKQASVVGQILVKSSHESWQTARARTLPVSKTRPLVVSIKRYWFLFRHIVSSLYALTDSFFLDWYRFFTSPRLLRRRRCSRVAARGSPAGSSRLWRRRRRPRGRRGPWPPCKPRGT